MRVAGAAAREMLVAAAAAQLGVRAVGVHVAKARASRTRHRDSSPPSASWRARRPPQSVPTSPALKDPGSLHAFAARRAQRLDIPSKVDGSAIYGIDFTMPGMLYAAVEIAPVYGGKLVSVDAAPPKPCPA